MKLMTNAVELASLILILVLIVVAVCLAAGLFIRRQKQKKQQQRQQKRNELAFELRQMSDVSLKQWYGLYRRGKSLPEYNAPDMRQVIEDEMRRRKFSLYFRN